MPQPNISQAGIYPTLPKSSGPESAPVTHQKAGNPGHLNRDSLSTVTPELKLKNGSLEPSRLSGSSLSDHDIQVVAPDDVEKKLPSEPSREEQLFSNASGLQKRISLKNSRFGARADRSSKDSLVSALKEAKLSLKEAKTLQTEAHKLARQGVLEENLLNAGLGGKEMTTAERLASEVAKETDHLVSASKQEVRNLDKALKELKTEEKKAAKADKKAHQALARLEKDATALGQSVQKIQSKVVAAKDESSKKLGEELKSLERALKKAKALVSHGQKLSGTAEAKQKKHGIGVSHVKSEVERHVSFAKAEATQLEAKVALLKKKVKSARKSEAEDKKAKKEFDKNIKQQEKAERKDSQKKAGLSQKVQTSDRPEQREVKPKTEEQKPEVAKPPSKKTQARRSQLRALNPEKTQMRAFLEGVKPHKGRSIQQLEKAMKSLHKPDDYKQLLADIGASGLAVNEKVRLRSNLSAAMLGAMKDPGQFKYFSREFIENVMFGDSMVEIRQQYPKSVEKDLERIEKEAARK